MTPTNDKTKVGLRGELGVIALVFMVIAFNGPASVILQYIPTIVSQGNGVGVPSMYLMVGLTVLVFSVGLNAMARRMTQPGGFYTFIAAGLGRPLGLASGLIALLSYILLGAGQWPLFAMGVQHLLEGTFHLSTTPSWWMIGLIGWALASTMSLLNIDFSTKILGTLATGEMLIALLWNVKVYWNGGPEGRVFNVFSSSFGSGAALAFVFGILSMTGFESLQVFRAESRDPERTVPRATYVSVGMIAVLYAASSYAYIISFGPSKVVAAGMQDPTGAMLVSLIRYLGAPAADLANCLLVTSIFAAGLAIHNIAARYMFTFGRDQVLPGALGKANVKHGSPMLAAAVTAAIIVLIFGTCAFLGLSAVNTFTFFQGMAGYCLIALWVGTSISVAFFSHRPDRFGKIGLWQGTIAPILSAIGLGAILYFTTINFRELFDGSQKLANIALALLGCVFITGILLALWYRRYRSSIYMRIGGG
jgi:amino acid transporter